MARFIKLINVPIEPIPMRYSADWQEWFMEAFDAEDDIVAQNMFEIINILGTDVEVRDFSIRTGEFLDAFATNIWKANQLRNIMSMFRFGAIDDHTVFFFHDLWFPGIQMLAYARNLSGINFKIVGCLHAGTWDKYDHLYKKGCSG